ncbi:2,3-bisphosphoglycerate-dependent phosphoglycerate mutase [Candidatus Similichlamydia laticola]|uniref:2,3-bisphosphoglycerate-dependent phosphoglycerate mutase n=1 Tax=Candidatus Similichlamydia laticola TaxID=2170265 RepID=UPI001C69BB6C|nr:2,3-bisphosphoglycerate-dependent phosphoglycerate mutase [Candidatus Similichlamydia laticola]
MLRHGQSAWNESGRFTGWVDVPLTEKGMQEAFQAGDDLAEDRIDLVFTSVLFRAVMTALFVCSKRRDRPTLSVHHSLSSRTPQKGHLDIFCHESLNERFYGDLQGLVKKDVMKRYGEHQVHCWRRGLYDQPPGGESLFDTSLRVIPFFEKYVVPCLVLGWNVLVVAHANSLRSLIIHLEQIKEDAVNHLELGTGIPRFYDYSSEGRISRG